MTLFSRNVQALLFGCLLRISACLTITALDDVTSFALGSAANLTCAHQTYSGENRWTVASVTVQECVVAICDVKMASDKARYSFEDDPVSGIFNFNIYPVQEADAGKVVGCYDGTNTSTFTLEVSGTLSLSVKNQTNHPHHLDNVTQSSEWQTVSHSNVTQSSDKSSQGNLHVILIAAISLVGMCVAALIIVSIYIGLKCAQTQ